MTTTGDAMAQREPSSAFERAEDIIRGWIEATDPVLSEIQNSVGMVIVGIVFLIGGRPLQRHTPEAWQIFELLDPAIWGLIYTAAGATHLILLRWRYEHFRRWVLLVKFALWVLLGTALLTGVGWFAPAVYIYYLFAVVAFRGYMKIQVGVH